MAKAMTKSQIADALAKKVDLKKKVAVQFLEELASLAYKEAKNAFTLPGLGKLVLVNFIYTTCPDVCPLFTAKLAAIQRTLAGEQRENYLLLSITTDPARDTPVKIKEYGEAFKPDFRRWHFLTGSPKDLAQVWKDFGVRVQDLGNGQIQHTNLTTLIDGKGLRRVDYYGDKWQEKEVLKDFRRLAGEK